METKDNRTKKLVIAGLVMIVCLSYIFSNRYIYTGRYVMFDTWKKEYLILSINEDKIIKVSKIEKAPEPKPKLYDSESSTTEIY